LGRKGVSFRSGGPGFNPFTVNRKLRFSVSGKRGTGNGFRGFPKTGGTGNGGLGGKGPGTREPGLNPVTGPGPGVRGNVTGNGGDRGGPGGYPGGGVPRGGKRFFYGVFPVFLKTGGFKPGENRLGGFFFPRFKPVYPRFYPPGGFFFFFF